MRGRTQACLVQRAVVIALLGGVASAWSGEGTFDFDTSPRSIMVEGLTYEQMTDRWNDRSPEYWQWKARQRAEFRRLGLEYWKSHPHSPRRALWLLNTLESPPYAWKDLRQGAMAYAARRQDTAIADMDALLEWERQYAVLRADCMADSRVDSGVKESIRALDLDASLAMDAWSYPPQDRLALRDIRSIHAIWDHYARQSAREYDPEQMARYVPLELYRLLQMGENDERMRRAVLDAFGHHPDPVVRWFIGGQRAVDALREKPFAMKLPVLDGPPVDLERMRGRIVLLDLWSNYCMGCIAAMPVLQELQERYGPSGLQVIGLWFSRASDEHMFEGEKASARRFLDKQGATYPNAVMPMADEKAFTDTYAITGFPVIWLLNREGRLAMTMPRKLEDTIRQMLGLQPLPAGAVTASESVRQDVAVTKELEKLYGRNIRNRRPGDAGD